MPILNLSADDQTLTVSADTPLLEVCRALPPGLYAPFAPVELPGGVGGLVTRGGFGQTFAFPSEVLGVTFRSPQGRVVRAGGRTVKNVQGYDLTRPFVGSFGRLGEALEVTFRLRPGRFRLHLCRPGRLEDFPDLPARFVWEDRGSVHALHFGHRREVERLAAAMPGAQPAPETQDLRPLFPAGMGVASTGAGAVRDWRLSWADGAEKPPVPPLFERLAGAL